MHNKRQRVDHSRHRRLRPRSNIGRRPRNRSGGRQSAKHRRENIGHALPNQLDVRIVPVVAHAVRNHRRHQRLNRAQHGHRERWAQQSMNQVRAEVRNLPVRQPARNSPKPRPNRFHRKLEKINRTSRKQQRNNRPWNARREPPANDQREQREHGERRRLK